MAAVAMAVGVGVAAPLSAELPQPFVFTELIKTGQLAPDGITTLAALDGVYLDGSRYFVQAYGPDPVNDPPYAALGVIGGPIGSPAQMYLPLPSPVSGVTVARDLFVGFTPIVEGDLITFHGATAPNENFTSGILGNYAAIGGTVTEALTMASKIPPGSVEQFDGFFSIGSHPNIDGGRVVMSAGYRDQPPEGAIEYYRGLYSMNPDGSGLVTIVDSRDALPDDPLTLFDGFGMGRRGAHDGLVTFVGEFNDFSDYAIFTSPIDGSAPPTAVITQDTPDPVAGGLGFREFNSNVAMDASGMAFRADMWGLRRGVFKLIGDELSMVADSDTLIPDGSGDYFQFFSSPDISNGRVVFTTYGRDINKGLYIQDTDGTLTQVMAEGDLYDGKAIAEVFYAPGGFEGDSLAFMIELEDGSQVALVTQVPEPTTLVCLASSMGLMIQRRQRHRLV